jgi:hypothetical protein
MRLISRMVLIAMVVGTATSVAATGRITILLLASGTACWSVVSLVQLCTGVLLVRGATVPLRRGLERYFGAHGPWSLWLLAIAGMVLLLPDPGGWIVPLALTFVVPLVFTFRRLDALCRLELGFSAAVARRRTLLHQGVTLLCLLAYGEYAGRFFPRFIDTVGW